MQFLILAYDATDDGALARRMAAREAHLANVERQRASGHLRMGVAILDEAGTMIGSCCVAEFPTRAEMDSWLAADPYVTGKVWDRIEVMPCKIAPPFLK